MKLLLYCVLRTPGGDSFAEGDVRGFSGADILHVSAAGLCAITSEWSEGKGMADAAELLDYGRVIEFFWKRYTVIPMRFGNVFEGSGEITRMLESRRESIVRVLDEIEDTSEMGIKMIVSATPGNAGSGGLRLAQAAPTAAHPDGSFKSAGSGKSYLALKKEFFARQEQETLEQTAGAEKLSKAFAGRFVKVKHETRPGCLSMNFLVRNCDVTAFREKFREICVSEDAGLLLSGPWPPYSFAEL